MKENNTIWRLQELDFLAIMSDRFPELSIEEQQRIIEQAKQHFFIPDWTEYVEIFIENNL